MTDVKNKPRHWILPSASQEKLIIEEATKTVPVLEVTPNYTYITDSQITEWVTELSSHDQDGCKGNNKYNRQLSETELLRNAQHTVFGYYTDQNTGGDGTRTDIMSKPVNPYEIFQRLQEEYLKLLKLEGLLISDLDNGSTLNKLLTENVRKEVEDDVNIIHDGIKGDIANGGISVDLRFKSPPKFLVNEQKPSTEFLQKKKVTFADEVHTERSTSLKDQSSPLRKTQAFKSKQSVNPKRCVDNLKRSLRENSVNKLGANNSDAQCSIKAYNKNVSKSSLDRSVKKRQSKELYNLRDDKFTKSSKVTVYDKFQNYKLSGEHKTLSNNSPDKLYPRVNDNDAIASVQVANYDGSSEYNYNIKSNEKSHLYCESEQLILAPCNTFIVSESDDSESEQQFSYISSYESFEPREDNPDNHRNIKINRINTLGSGSFVNKASNNLPKICWSSPRVDKNKVELEKYKLLRNEGKTVRNDEHRKNGYNSNARKKKKGKETGRVVYVDSLKVLPGGVERQHTCMSCQYYGSPGEHQAWHDFYMVGS